MSENSPTPPPSDIPAAPPYPGYAAQSPAPQYPQQQYTGGYTPYPAAPKTNVLAIVSLIAGIGGLVLLPLVASIVAVITGHMALNRLKTNGEGGRGLALAGTITGWVGIAFGLLLAIFVIAIIGFAAAGAGYSSYNS